MMFLKFMCKATQAALLEQTYLAPIVIPPRSNDHPPLQSSRFLDCDRIMYWQYAQRMNGQCLRFRSCRRRKYGNKFRKAQGEIVSIGPQGLDSRDRVHGTIVPAGVNFAWAG